MVNQNQSLPEPKITVGDKELHMSYGMFNDLMRLMGNVDDVSYILINDPMTRDLVIRRLFTEGKLTKEEDLIDSNEIDISITDISTIVAWVADHVSHFLLSTGQALRPVLEKYQSLTETEKEKNQSSKQSKSGSTDSTG